MNLIQTHQQQRLSENNHLSNNRNGFFSTQQDLGMIWKIDTLGSELDTRFGYSFNSGITGMDYQTSFLAPTSHLIMGEGDNFQRRHFIQMQTDLTYVLPHRIRLETGLKSTYQHYDSDANYYFNMDDELVSDPSRTNAFNYQERINAVYAQASVPLPGRLLLKGGLRLEHTFMEGKQTVPSDTSFVVNRADLFPYLYLSRPVVEIAGYELRAYAIYRRTIGRPGYQHLNPYIRFVDQYLYEMGNPALKPQFTENVEANISFDDTPIFAVGHNRTRDIFSGVVYQDPQWGNVAIRTFDNVGRNRETYFRAAGAIPPGGKYFFVMGGQYNLNHYEGFYENQPLSFSRGSWRLFTFHSLNLTPTTRLTMMGFVMLNGQQNFYELDTFGQLNFGLNQSFMNRRLNVSLSARDVLRTMVTPFSLNQGSVSMQGERYSDNQRFGINIRYTFGVRQKRERQQMFRFEMDE